MVSIDRIYPLYDNVFAQTTYLFLIRVSILVTLLFHVGVAASSGCGGGSVKAVGSAWSLSLISSGALSQKPQIHLLCEINFSGIN